MDAVTRHRHLRLVGFDLPDAAPQSPRTLSVGVVERDLAHDGDIRHLELRLLGVAVSAPPELTFEARALIAALAEFTDETRSAAFNPALHPRNPKGSPGGGRFRSLVARVLAALEAWSKGDSPSNANPFEGLGFKREHLRDAAKHLGIPLRRGATEKEIVDALKADVKAKRAGTKEAKTPTVGKPVRFTLTGGKATTAEVLGTLESDLRKVPEGRRKTPLGRSSPADVVKTYRERLESGELKPDVVDDLLQRLLFQNSDAGGKPDDALYKQMGIDNPVPPKDPRLAEAIKAAITAVRAHKNRDLDVGVFSENGKVSLWEVSDTGERRRRVALVDDLAGLEAWADEHGESELARWARRERGGTEPAKAPARKATAKPASKPAAGIPVYTPPDSLTPEERARAERLVRADPQIFATVQDRIGPISTSGNLNDEDAAWLQSVAEREPAFVNRLAQNAQIESNLRRAAKKAGQTPTEFKRDVADKLREVFADKPIAVRVSDEAALRGVLNDGRLKTQFDKGMKRAGWLQVNLDHRRLGEQVSGVDPDTPPEQRPVYGYVAVNGVEPALSAGQKIPGIAQAEGQEDILSTYGKVQVVLKPGVRARTTATVGDSLDQLGMVQPSPVDNPSAHSASVGYNFGVDDLDRLTEPGWTRHSYVEAQIHGGVRTGDIAEVVFPSEPESATRSALVAAGIPWRVLTPGQKSEPLFDPSVHALREAKVKATADALGKLRSESDILAHIDEAALSRPELDALGKRLGVDVSAVRGERAKAERIAAGLARAKKAPVGLAALGGGGAPAKAAGARVANLPPVQVHVDASSGSDVGRWRATHAEGLSGSQTALLAAVTDRVRTSGRLANGRLRTPDAPLHNQSIDELLGRVPLNAEKAAKAAAAADRHIGALDKAMEQSRLPTDAVLWRGIRPADVSLPDGDATGFEWTDPAYVGTSGTRNVAEGSFAQGALLRIAAPSGTRAIGIQGGGEHEVLLDRGQRFRVVADRRTPSGARELDVEIVGTAPDVPAKATKAAKKAAAAQPAADLSHLRTLDPEVARDELDLIKVGTVDDPNTLKGMLRAQGLPVSGKKRDLVDRLVESLAQPTREDRIKQLMLSGLTRDEAEAQLAGKSVRPSGLPAKPMSADFDDLAERLSTGTQAQVLEVLQDLNATELTKLARKFPGTAMFVPGVLKTSERRQGMRIPEGLSLEQMRQWLAKQLMDRRFQWRSTYPDDDEIERADYEDDDEDLTDDDAPSPEEVGDEDEEFDDETLAHMHALLDDEDDDYPEAQRADLALGGERLHRYWTIGKGLRKWLGHPHPWTSLYRHLRKFVGSERAKRMAAKWVHEVTGNWPGSDAHRVAHGHPPRGKRMGPG